MLAMLPMCGLRAPWPTTLHIRDLAELRSPPDPSERGPEWVQNGSKMGPKSTHLGTLWDLIWEPSNASGSQMAPCLAMLPMCALRALWPTTHHIRELGKH